MSSQEVMWLIGAVFSMIVTFVGCTGTVMVFLWRRFDSVFEQIERINIAQHENYVKHETCKDRIVNIKVDWMKDINARIFQHEKEMHSKNK
jgi:hypothetical protein